MGRCRVGKTRVGIRPTNEAEVGYSDPQRIVDEHIVGFEIAVNETRTMGRRQSFSRLDEDLDDGAPRMWPPLEPLAEGLAIHPFHGNEQ